MTMVRFLPEYTIETICKGSKSEYARHFELEYAELGKFRKRISEGDSSNRVTEALHIMHWRDCPVKSFATYLKDLQREIEHIEDN